MKIALAAGITASVLMSFVLSAVPDRAEKSNFGTDVLAALVVGAVVGLLVLLWIWAV
jgi:hypothetical protein